MQKPVKTTLTISDILFVVVAFAILGSITYYSINVIKVRNRDADRVANLNLVKSALSQKYALEHKYPHTDYRGLKTALSFFLSRFPQDPQNSGSFTYHYIATPTAYVLYAKMESKNSSALNDHGKYNRTPLYYEIGAGPNWQSLIPTNLK